MNTTILVIDLLIVLVTLSGLVYNFGRVREKRFKLSRRDWGLMMMYLLYFNSIFLTFILEFAIYKGGNHITIEFYNWVIATRISFLLFTLVAVSWSSGYKFGGYEKSGI